MTSPFKYLRFEVFGTVQRVFFRKHTKEAADALGLVGWCQNTAEGTVIGEAEGPATKIASFKTWLETKGSPKSVIERLDVKEEKDITELSFKAFDVDRTKSNRF